MSFENMCKDYEKSIKEVEFEIKRLNLLIENENSLEMKRKIREKVMDLESMLTQTVYIYHYIKNFDDVDSKVKGFI